MEFQYKDKTIIYDIVYEKRKKTLLSIDPSGFVKLKAPKGTDADLLLSFLEAHAPQIIAHLDRQTSLAERAQGPQEKRFMEGEAFLYLGRTYPITIMENPSADKNAVAFDGKVLTVTVSAAEEQAVRDALLRFYTRESRRLILKRIAFYQEQFKVKPSLVEIKDTPTKWGMCSSDRKLMFNWKLIMAPQEALDYVVVHEMCHMVHMNHDRSFWRLVGKILPDYETRTQWLAQNGAEMSF